MPILRRRYKTGQLVELSHFPVPMWPGFGVADHRIAAKADFPSLARVTGQSFRLPDDTYDTETHFRFPDGTRLRRGAAVVAGSNYLLDDAGPLAAAFGGGHLGMVAPDYVLGQRVLTAAGSQRWGLPAAISDGIPVPDDMLAFEVIVTAPYHAAQVGYYMIGGGIAGVNAGGGPVDSMSITLRVHHDKTELRYSNITNSISGLLATLPADAADGQRIGIYFNPGTAEVGVIFDGTDYGYLPGFTLPGSVKLVPWLFISDSALTSGATVGQTASVQMVKSATALTHDYPAAVVGIDTPASAGVGERRGSTKSGGTALTGAQNGPHSHGHNYVPNSAGNGVSWSPAADGDGPLQTGVSGEGDPHDHDVDPEHVIFCVLVKL